MSAYSNKKTVFGQTMSKKNNNSRYRRQMGNNSSNSSHSKIREGDEESWLKEKIAYASKIRKQKRQEALTLDTNFGYAPLDFRKIKDVVRGWVFNIVPTTVLPSDAGDEEDEDNFEGSSSSGPERAGVDLYLLSPTNSTFKCTVLYRPYFYLLPSFQSEEISQTLESLKSTLLKNYQGCGLVEVNPIYREDLDEVNHLGHGRKGRLMLKLLFDNTQCLMDVREQCRKLIRTNKTKVRTNSNETNPLDCLVDIREYDVPYTVRVCTDLDIRVGAWYTINQDNSPSAANYGAVTLSDPDNTKKADPSFLAFDIECTKAPLKFPDSNVDSIFMISYMVSGKGYLIISRDVVSQDIQDFEYTPKPTYPGPFHIFNEINEESLIRRFLSHFEELKPQIVVTYNGDFFDWPFLEARAARYNLNLGTTIGISKQMDDSYRGTNCVHLDAFHWVRRDSYLPQGSQGLKAVTKYKLGYDPVEVDPEDMVRFAREKPHHMAAYSVSDAVATYYLYEKYVHMFIFSLCTIIPMAPEDVLRKGSGTLCEALLMVQAFQKNIVCPNKEVEKLEKFYNGHLLESETYIGGKVECLESGVFRSDVEYEFNLKPEAFQMLIDNIDRDLTFAIEVEEGIDRSSIVNYDEVRCDIIEQLELLRDSPHRFETPYIYHLDVGAMYPNIILTNRLQPSAIVNDAICAACDFNQAKNQCKRKMNWVWRGDYNPASKAEFHRVKEQLSRESVEGTPFHELDPREQAEAVALRLKQYAKNAYQKTKITLEEERNDTVCMRENGFYVETVRQFRDRRYEYKKMTKVWKGRKSSAEKSGDAVARKEAEDSELVYDSLQIAHKCILNSFYGYVMRKGARWRSMEMAGIVTKTGSDLITQARILVEQIGRPLELDTDGIWCILPKSFPDVYKFKTKEGKSIKLEYPCAMLNADVHDKFTNDQYQTIVDKDKKTYETRSDNSIFFEVDGPYRCMVIPSSTEEGKLLKKRYAVFNHDGSLAELKGFELKRRGELELIKTFQSQIFSRFLDGDNLKECYDSVAEVANHWLDIMDTQGESLETDELFDLICENRNMSRQLDDYGTQKGTSQTTARRLGEFLGAEIIKDKGLNCKFIITERPHGAPVTDRAIPVAIWKSEPAVMKFYMRKWLKSPGMDDGDFDIRNVLDWDYYKARLAKTIQKIITIPAALQKIQNPVPRVPHPDWLERTVRRMNDTYRQMSIKSMFGVRQNLPQSLLPITNMKSTIVLDIEDISSTNKPATGRPIVHSRRRTNPKITVHMSEQKLPPPVALTKENFSLWLVRKKIIWRNRRSTRKIRSRGASTFSTESKSTDIESKKQRAGGTMQEYIKEAAMTLTQSEWQIIEIRELSESQGKFLVWIMLNDDTLQKVHLNVPRTFYVNAYGSMKSTEELTVKKVERHLPHNKTAQHLMEVTMPESVFAKHAWENQVLTGIAGTDVDINDQCDVVEGVYQTETPLLLQALMNLGCISKVVTSPADNTNKSSFELSDLAKVERPSQGEYLHSKLAYRRIFLYESLHLKKKTGLIALFVMESGAHGISDFTRPHTAASKGKYRLDAACHVWIVKPNASKGQKNVSAKQCETTFTQILQELGDDGEDEESDYSSLSQDTKCTFRSLNFANDEKTAFGGVNTVLNNILQEKKGPTFLLVNALKPLPLLRKAIPSSSEFPLVSLPFPPVPAHTQSSLLPALNWEPLAVQLSLEAYIHMGVVSYPRRARCARFGNVPIGNLGWDENSKLYDVFFSRLLRKSGTILWASEVTGRADFGLGLMDCAEDSSDANVVEDEEEVISPIVKTPGSYRKICVEIDVQDLVIAAMTDSSFVTITSTSQNDRGGGGTLESAFENKDGTATTIAQAQTELGDEMSCSMSLQILRVLVQTWMREAREHNSHIADDLLHHLYRLVCSPDTLLHDPALHRVVHSLMKATFHRLLAEFQRLGATIVCASFHRIVVATNKEDLQSAKEYIDFVISTILKLNGGQMSPPEGLGRISLRPSNFWTEYLFLNEHNFGGILFEPRSVETEEEEEWAVHVEEEVFVPTVVSGWNVMQFLASEIQQEYFRTIVGRFSKDLFRKRILIEQKLEKKKNIDESNMLTTDPSVPVSDQVLEFKKKLISKHFSSYLTRAVGEILNDQGNADTFPQLPGSHLDLTNPVLEFVKNVLVVLELDSQVETEVQIMKRNLLAQIAVQEFSNSTIWKDPCASFILPDVFCIECHEIRDVNLCVVVPQEEDEQARWQCEDCASPFNTEHIEWRLVDMIQRKSARYQLQDLYCMKTQGVATRALAKQSDCSAELKLQSPRKLFLSQLSVLRNLADYYGLEWLLEISNRLLDNVPGDFQG